MCELLDFYYYLNINFIFSTIIFYACIQIFVYITVNRLVLLTSQEKSSGRSAHYKLTSTAMLWLQTNKQGSGTMNLGGSLTRQVSSAAFLSQKYF